MKRKELTARIWTDITTLLAALAAVSYLLRWSSIASTVLMLLFYAALLRMSVVARHDRQRLGRRIRRLWAYVRRRRTSR
jgi:hypothetical protein